MPPTAVQTDWSRNQSRSHRGLLTDSSEYFKWAKYTSRSLEDPVLLIYSAASYMPFTWTISKLWCKSEWLPGQYERTLIRKSHFGLCILKYQQKQHFPLFIARWITSQWNIKTLIYQCCYYFSLSVKSPREISLWDLPPAGQHAVLTASQSWCSKPGPGRAHSPACWTAKDPAAAFVLDPSPMDGLRISDSLQKKQLKPVYMWSKLWWYGRIFFILNGC